MTQDDLKNHTETWNQWKMTMKKLTVTGSSSFSPPLPSLLILPFSPSLFLSLSLSLPFSFSPLFVCLFVPFISSRPLHSFPFPFLFIFIPLSSSLAFPLILQPYYTLITTIHSTLLLYHSHSHINCALIAPAPCHLRRHTQSGSDSTRTL